jgi:hypothetical protein
VQRRAIHGDRRAAQGTLRIGRPPVLDKTIIPPGAFTDDPEHRPDLLHSLPQCVRGHRRDISNKQERRALDRVIRARADVDRHESTPAIG